MQVPSSVLGDSSPLLLDALATEHLLSIIEGDFIELDDLIDWSSNTNLKTIGYVLLDWVLQISSQRGEGLP